VTDTHCKSFKARLLADGFLTDLKDAVRDRRLFNPRTGLPGAESAEGEMVTWYAHARSYAEAKWGSLVKASRCLAVSPPSLGDYGQLTPGDR
jgi:hypothetical protein